MKLSFPSRKFITIAAIIVAGIAAFAFYNNVSAKPDPKAGGGMPPGFSMKVEGIKAESKSLSQRIQIIGSLLANESVILSSEVPGRISSIPFKEGTEVSQGALLFKLDDSVQRAQLAQAQANLAEAENNSKRYGELVKTGAISKMQFDQAGASLNSARANVQFANATLSKTSIRAPFSGSVGVRQVSVGDVVMNGQKLVSLEQVTPIRVQFTVAERYISQIKPGQKIELTSEAMPGEIFEAEVSAVDPRIDPSSRSVAVQAIAPNKDKKLFSGQFVSINLPIGARDNVVVIPDQALIPLGDKTFVFKVVGGKAERAEVKVGLRENSEAEITSGVNAGDTVVTAGHQKLQPGIPVRVAPPTIVNVTPPSEERE